MEIKNVIQSGYTSLKLRSLQGKTKDGKVTSQGLLQPLERNSVASRQQP